MYITIVIMKVRGDLHLKVFHHTQLGDYNILRDTLRNLDESDPYESSKIVNMIDPLTTDSPLMMAARKGERNFFPWIL